MGFTNPYPASRLTVDSTNSLGTGLLLWAPLTEGTGTTADCIVHAGHTGTQSGGVSWASDTIGSVASFDGVDDYFDFGTFSSYFPGPSITGSISGWVKWNSGRTIPIGGQATGNERLYIGVENGNWDVGFGNYPWNSNYTGTLVAAVSGEWAHVVVSISSGVAKLYVNGSETITKTADTSVSLGGQFSIGAYIGPSGINANHTDPCEIQNVRIYDRALSATEVATLYHRPWEGSNYGNLWPYSPPAAGSMTVDSSNSIVTGMNAWFPLTEAGGTSAQCILHPSHVGTLQGDAAFVSSEIGGALSCSGISQSGVDVPTNPASSVPITVSAWFKTSNTSSDMYIIDGDDSSDRIAIYRNTGGTLIAYAGGSCFFGTSSSVIADGNWHHVAAVCTSSAITVYFDGVQDGTGSAATNSISGFRIGARFSISSNWDGELQNVRTYDRVLSATEVATLYERPWEGIEYGDTFHYDPPAPASMLPLTSDSINTDQELWLPLTETDDYASGAKDINGSSDGTQSGGVLSKSSVIGGVASFDGTNDIIATSGVTTDFSTTDYTASLWVRLNSTTGNQYFLSKWGSVSGYAVFFWLNSGTGRVRVQIGTTGNTATVAEYDIASELTTDFRNLALVLSGNKFSSSSISLYMDGVLLSPDSTTNGTGALLDGDGDFAIAGRPDGIPRYVDGDIGNVRLWSRALTADEIWSIYQNPWLGSNYKLASGSGSTPLYNYIFRTERFRRLG